MTNAKCAMGACELDRTAFFTMFRLIERHFKMNGKQTYLERLRLMENAQGNRILRRCDFKSNSIGLFAGFMD